MEAAHGAAAKLVPTSRQAGRGRLRVVSYALPTPPRLGFTVTETVRPPQPVEPDPFIAAPKPA